MKSILSPVLRRAVLIALLVAAWSSPLPAAPQAGTDLSEECTIAILTGAATRDGRPILWKNRDAAYTDNEVVFFDEGGYKFVALVNAGETDKAWIGLNDRGFAILNALTYNLPDTVMGGITNGELMKIALGRCATVAEFESYLRETSKIGRDNPANIAVIDAAGGAAVFEAAGRDYVRFDAKREAQGFLARTNFSLSGDTSYVETWRYNRCRRLLKKGIAEGGADVAYMLQTVARDLCAYNLNPYPLPFEGKPPGFPQSIGYVETTNTINRRTSVSGGAVLGVLPKEDPLLSTFYPMVGQPVVTIPLPVWVAAGPTPPELDGPITSPLCDLAKERMRLCYDDPAHYQLLNTYRLVDPEGSGFLTRAERVERWLLPEIYLRLEHWRRTGPDAEEMAQVEAQLATRAVDHYRADPQPSSPPSRFALRLVGPNPSTEAVRIRYESEEALPGGWSIAVITPEGRRVTTLHLPNAISMDGTLVWDGRDDDGARVSSGVYFLKPNWPVDARGCRAVIIR